MHIAHDRVFVFLKARIDSASSPSDIVLEGEHQLLTRDFVGDLFVTLVHDDGKHFRFLMHGDLAALGMTEDAAFALGAKNLESLLDAGVVRAHAAGAAVAIIAGGNFEASLLLVPRMWSWVCEHLGATRLLAAAPARDLLMVVNADDPQGRADLAAFVTRTSGLTLDHCMSNMVLLWDGAQWTVHRNVQPTAAV